MAGDIDGKVTPTRRMPLSVVHSREWCCFGGKKIVSPGRTAAVVSSVQRNPSPDRTRNCLFVQVPVMGRS